MNQMPHCDDVCLPLLQRLCKMAKYGKKSAITVPLVRHKRKSINTAVLSAPAKHKKEVV